MQINKWIKKVIRETDLDGLQPGSPEFFKVQESIIQRKPLLKRSFLNFYKTFEADLKSAPSTSKLLTLELGSGGGFLREVVPDVITSDIYPTIADMTIDARHLPFDEGTVRGIFMGSVLHHIPAVRLFFRELQRVLVDGGVCAIIEPANTPFARFFYRKFHHEPFLPNEKLWEFEQNDAMLDSNQALSWIIFERDRKQFETQFPNLRIEKILFLPTLGYLLSGGINYRTFIPNCFAKLVPSLETSLSFSNRYFSLAWYILIRKV